MFDCTAGFRRFPQVSAPWLPHSKLTAAAPSIGVRGGAVVRFCQFLFVSPHRTLELGL